MSIHALAFGPDYDEDRNEYSIECECGWTYTAWACDATEEALDNHIQSTLRGFQP